MLAMPALSNAASARTVALLFDSLTSPFWVAARDLMRREAARRGFAVLEAVSNMDDNKQFQQVRSMLERGVDGIIIVHTDDKAVIPAIRAANAVGVPMVHFNRPPAPSDAKSIAIVADNRKIMRETVGALVAKAKASGGHYRAALLVGDLGDANAVQRRAGFHDAVDTARDFIEVIAEIPTEWNADKAFSGLSNALQGHPDINFLVSSSDFLLPQVEQALRVSDKWHRDSEPGHILLGSFDGDANAYRALEDGYLDADGVQDLELEVRMSFNGLERLASGEVVPNTEVDPGLVVTRERLQKDREHMWGYLIGRSSRVAAEVPAVSTAAIPFNSGRAAVNLVGSIGDVLLSMLPLAILVTGQSLVLLVGQIDLSMTATMALTSIVSANVMTHGFPTPGGPVSTLGGILVALLIGACVGLFNGICTAILRMPAFIVTLAVLMAGSGAAVWYASTVSDSISIGGLPDSFRAIGFGSVAGIPISFIICAVTLLIAWFMLSRTLMGRWVYAAGQNANAARLCGVPVSWVTICMFVASGLCASLASIIYTSRIETGTPTLGQNMLLDVIGAAVIGGVSLFGGRGNILLALIGVAFVCVLDKSLQLLGLSLFLVLAIKGGAILIAAILDAFRHRRSVSK
jgi:ribose/xylose/arabinose/galactoside ABC-type transport system permease subunit/ABC-type sugar transport system substrate-binding protein